MNPRVLLAGPGDLLEAAKAQLTHLDLTCATDGAALFEAFVGAARAGQAPQLVVVELALERMSGMGVVRAMRATERAWSRRPTAVLLYAARPADAELKAFLAEVGQAVHLERPIHVPIADQVARLQTALDRLLAQLKGG